MKEETKIAIKEVMIEVIKESNGTITQKLKERIDSRIELAKALAFLLDNRKRAISEVERVLEELLNEAD